MFSDVDSEIKAMSQHDRVVTLKLRLVARATGGDFEGDERAYRALRNEIRSSPVIYEKLPAFVRQCTDLGQFWGHIKGVADNYEGRRQYLWREFAPVIEYLESAERSPSDVPIGQALNRLNSDAVQEFWDKALARRGNDPDGAITAARSLLETVCKYVLDECGVPYGANEDLPKLWHMASEQLVLTPAQQRDAAYKALLGNCASVVSYLANIRNNEGDAHGSSRGSTKPSAKHAELAVNLAGTMAAFIVATWEERQQGA